MHTNEPIGRLERMASLEKLYLDFIETDKGLVEKEKQMIRNAADEPTKCYMLVNFVFNLTRKELTLDKRVEELKALPSEDLKALGSIGGDKRLVEALEGYRAYLGKHKNTEWLEKEQAQNHEIRELITGMRGIIAELKAYPEFINPAITSIAMPDSKDLIIPDEKRKRAIEEVKKFCGYISECYERILPNIETYLAADISDKGDTALIKELNQVGAEFLTTFKYTFKEIQEVAESSIFFASLNTGNMALN
jgi:hypothetical protein